MRLARAERADAVETQRELAAADAAKLAGDFVGVVQVDVADEAERQVIVLGVDPARARQAAAEERQAVADIARNFDAGEETRHGVFLLSESRPPIYNGNRRRASRGLLQG